ncbi:DUF4157 domain-containing protein [Sphaerothrix gracilis]|uniref:eCIS core domain-containing protein n=1 Tax=Sphaerothrix gracilis TaxID=3151835 RepID=UPI0031FBFC4D
MKTYAPKSSWKSSLARSKSAADKSKPLAQAKQESGTQPEAASERGWGTMTDNVMRSLAAQESGSSQGIILQPKLTIGQAGDKYEQEADRVAKQVVRQMNAPVTQPPIGRKTIQRLGLAGREELQRQPIIQAQRAVDGGQASTALETSINHAKGQGKPLDQNLQQSMGWLIGANFSRVKVHTDSQSDKLNRSLSSRAFTIGDHVFFKRGEYNTSSRSGRELIAHELTHVVQQKGNEVISKSTQPVAKISSTEVPLLSRKITNISHSVTNKSDNFLKKTVNSQHVVKVDKSEDVENIRLERKVKAWYGRGTDKGYTDWAQTHGKTKNIYDQTERYVVKLEDNNGSLFEKLNKAVNTYGVQQDDGPPEKANNKELNVKREADKKTITINDYVGLTKSSGYGKDYTEGELNAEFLFTATDVTTNQKQSKVDQVSLKYKSK